MDWEYLERGLVVEEEDAMARGGREERGDMVVV